MAKDNRRNQVVKFHATKIVSKPIIVSFTSKDGRKVTFRANKTESKDVPVSFRQKKK